VRRLALGQSVTIWTAALLLMTSAALIPAAGVGDAPTLEAGRKHWAFQKLVRPAVPVVDVPNVASPVDAFLLARLRAKGLTFSPQADAHALLRRLAFDLTGLPPTVADIADFERESRMGKGAAYARLVDRLLASPRFGERWGRHWLDNAGYSDITGTDNDAGIIRLSESRWKYRDWVVRAFNQDVPFDAFVHLQLAGDELVDWRNAAKYTPEVVDSLVATGFLRLAADDTEENELNTADIRHGVLQRTLETVASNLLGLTLGCAKCHDHKYEPISHRDYYRLQALLQPALNPDHWLQPSKRQLPDIPAADKRAIDKHNQDIEQKLAELKKRHAALGTGKEQDKERAALDQQMSALNGQRRGWGSLQAVYDVAAPPATHRLHRGNLGQPRETIAPGFLEVIEGSEPASWFKRAVPVGPTSGRRLALARWLTDPDSLAADLVVRVRVNRIWHHLFGRGLAASTDNLGLAGAAPTHPELFDWLAAEFRAGGYRLKPFLKMVVMTDAYRQASAVGTDSASVSRDPDNVLLGRMRLRRLESEAIRDAVLAASGRLDVRIGGAPVPVEARPDGAFAVKAGPDAGRRSLYLLARRNYHPTVLGVFDQPNLTTNCTGRSTSAVVLQTLTMLNDAFVLEQAATLAERLERSAATDAERIELAFLLTLSRPPTAEERRLSEELLAKQRALPGGVPQSDATQRLGLASLSHMLLNTSEFLYVP
jgi:hypothetical protein